LTTGLFLVVVNGIEEEDEEAVAGLLLDIERGTRNGFWWVDEEPPEDTLSLTFGTVPPDDVLCTKAGGAEELVDGFGLD
jgi:hypothetical protein